MPASALDFRAITGDAITMRLIPVWLLLVPFLTACGTTERREIMLGRDADQVWAAMKAVAQTPDYYMSSDNVSDRWLVRENHVAYDDDVRRIEVLRRLERELHKPMAQPRYEHREWKFEIVLEEGVAAGPVIRFRTRNTGVPAHAWNEARWYFDEVEAFLGPAPQTPAPPSEPAATDS